MYSYNQLFFLLFFLTTINCFCQIEVDSKKSPNILFIFSDDHATNAISAYGGIFKELAPTPNIDRIANEGALLTNALCTNAICGPSRAAILTGKYSHINGLIDNRANRNFDGSQVQVQKLLGQANYQTAWIVL